MQSCYIKFDYNFEDSSQFSETLNSSWIYHKGVIHTTLSDTQIYANSFHKFRSKQEQLTL